MALSKGYRNNPAGRPKGSRNKVTKELKEQISIFLSGNWKTIEKDFKCLDPKDKLTFYEKLLKYSIPTIATTKAEVDFSRFTDEQLDTIIDKFKLVKNEKD